MCPAGGRFGVVRPRHGMRLRNREARFRMPETARNNRLAEREPPVSEFSTDIFAERRAICPNQAAGSPTQIFPLAFTPTLFVNLELEATEYSMSRRKPSTLAVKRRTAIRSNGPRGVEK